jgi:hypothetical protein
MAGVGGIGANRAGSTGSTAATQETTEKPRTDKAPAAPAATATASGQATVGTASGQFRSFRADPMALAIRARVESTPIGPAPGTAKAESKGFLAGIASRFEEAAGTINRAYNEVSGVVSREVSDGMRRAGEAYDNVARGVDQLRDDVANGVRSLGQQAVEAGERGLRDIQQGYEQLARGAQDIGRDLQRTVEGGLDDARRAIDDGIDAGRSLVRSVEPALDPGSQIANLNSEGDAVKISLGGYAQAEVRGAAQGELELKRTADGYELSVSGQAGIGVIGQLGGKAGAEASAEAFAMLQGGGKLTLKFANAAEAERAVGIFARQAAVAGASAAGGPLGGLTGAAAQALIGPSPDDLRFLANRVDSVEVRGGLAAEIAGELGAADTLALEGSASGSYELGAKISFKPDASGNARPSELTLFAEASIAAEGKAAAVETAQAGIQGKVRLEQTYNLELPSNLTTDAFLRDPAGALRSEIARREGTTKLTIEGEARGGGGVSAAYASVTGEGGGAFELSASGNTADLNAAARRALSGDVAGAVRQLGNDVTVEGKLQGFVNSNVEFAPEVSAFGIGAGIEAQYQLQDRSRALQFKTTPNQAVAELERFLQQIDPALLQAAAGVR